MTFGKTLMAIIVIAMTNFAFAASFEIIPRSSTESENRLVIHSTALVPSLEIDGSSVYTILGFDEFGQKRIEITWKEKSEALRYAEHGFLKIWAEDGQNLDAMGPQMREPSEINREDFYALRELFRHLKKNNPSDPKEYTVNCPLKIDFESSEQNGIVIKKVDASCGKK